MKSHCHLILFTLCLTLSNMQHKYGFSLRARARASLELYWSVWWEISVIPLEEQPRPVPLKRVQNRGLKDEGLLNQGSIYHDKLSFTVKFLGATSHRGLVLITTKSQRNTLFPLVIKDPIWNTSWLFARIPNLTFYQEINRHLQLCLPVFNLGLQLHFFEENT